MIQPSFSKISLWDSNSFSPSYEVGQLMDLLR